VSRDNVIAIEAIRKDGALTLSRNRAFEQGQEELSERGQKRSNYTLIYSTKSSHYHFHSQVA
jgi:hypothetical protein